MKDNNGTAFYTSEEIIDILKSQKLINLYNMHKINSVIVFGSIVTKDFEDYSDVDIAILSKTRLSLNNIMILEEEIGSILGREIDIIDLGNEKLDLNIKVSVYDNGIVVYNDEFNLYEYDYNITDKTYKENEEFRYFRERDVIYDE